LKQPPNRTARNADEAIALAREIGYPLVVRPSYVLGGRAMEVVHDDQDLARYIRDAVRVSNDSPVLLDRFLDHATEVDVDLVADAEGNVLIGGVMEHIEEAGVHSGDSSCSLPPYSLSADMQDRLREQVSLMARELKVIGLMNTQFAVQGDAIFVLEVNPRASRTVPFVSKATGVSLAKIAARCMVGRTLREQGLEAELVPDYYSVKEAIFPFLKFQNVDPILGPEMRSTGEVMGVGRTFGEAFARAHEAAGIQPPALGKAFLSVRESDKARLVPIASDLLNRGFSLVATGGTCAYLTERGIPCERINKVIEGRPHIVDLIKNREIMFIVNTTEGKQAIADSFSIRRQALMHKVSYTTTLAAARATCQALRELDNSSVNCLQDLHRELLA
jgi:carbamoyl-phosphate synthase large subunit